ncbi:polysaccharide deacetylase family protein [Kribbella sp. NBC_00382]|uniref:polysaccharide deacetylase family protein n=1 Tax=Kribbella sp. NBC_00382 TaxID=2975967 RepID=UPI002E1DB269
MTLPPGKLFLIAAILFGAALAQAATPATPPAAAHHLVASGPAGPAPLKISTASKVVAKHRSTGRKNQRTTTPAVADDWTLTNDGKVLYLTFDDGPQVTYTPQVLRVLARHHAKATFFVLGREAAAHPELVELARSQGHHIGNHTWDHPMLTHLTPKRVREEIFSGVKSKCFRPPYRDTNAAVAAVAAANHQRQILWDVDTNDWEKPGAAAIQHEILRGARPGAIILMHDGGGTRTQTVAALDRALTVLSARGYTFRSLPC